MLRDIDTYISKHTSEGQPWQSTIVRAYLESMLHSTDILTQYALALQAITTEFLPNSFWKTANHYNTPQHRAIIAYSMLKKDEKLFEMIQHIYFPKGFVRMFISRELFTSYIETTDEEVLVDDIQYMGATDMNFYTDMNTGFIYEVFMEVYGDASDASLGLLPVSSLIEKEKEMGGFISIVKPARVNVILARVPCVVLGHDGSKSIKSGLCEITNASSSNYLFTASNINRLKQLSLGSLYDIIPGKITIQGSLLAYPANVSFEEYNGYLKCIYYVQRDSTLVEDFSDLWKGLVFSVPGYGEVIFNIVNVEVQLFSSIYFAKIEIILPFKEV